MSEPVIVLLALLGAFVAMMALAVWRDVRVAKHTKLDPRDDRQAQRDAARQVRGGQEGQG